MRVCEHSGLHYTYVRPRTRIRGPSAEIPRGRCDLRRRGSPMGEMMAVQLRRWSRVNERE